MVNAMRAALSDAGRTHADVGHVNAHGLATRTCDVDEAKAIMAVFGKDQPQVPVVAPKSYFGNLGAGGGNIELVASLMAMASDRLFPVLNFETADPECPLNVVTDAATPSGDLVLAMSVTPQAQASVVLVQRFVA